MGTTKSHKKLKEIHIDDNVAEENYNHDAGKRSRFMIHNNNQEFFGFAEEKE